MCDSRMFDTLLEIAIEDPVKQEHNWRVWTGLSGLNAEFLRPLNNAEDAAERLAKSIVVQDKAVSFVESFTDTCGRETATLYCHHAMDHIPQMVRDSPVDIQDLSQQYVEHALKQGKSDMHNFTNNRLVEGTNTKGRIYQVMAKDRERVHLKRVVAMPATGNEKRQLGDESKEVEKAVERAGRKGLLISRSNLQIDKKLERNEQQREKHLADFEEQRLLTAAQVVEEIPASLNPLETSLSDRGANGPAKGGAEVPAAVAAEEPAAATAAMRATRSSEGPGGGAAPGGAQSTQQGIGSGVRVAAGRGRASAAAGIASTSAGRGRGAGSGRARGTIGRGRGRTGGGRWIPAGAMAID